MGWQGFEKAEGLRCATVRSGMVRKDRSMSTEGAKNRSMRRPEVFAVRQTKQPKRGKSPVQWTVGISPLGEGLTGSASVASLSTDRCEGGVPPPLSLPHREYL
ncbi:MAG: hypothetical protein CVV35_10310 [Methanomicrobiales archaeon HGW-Methanomicrobiales-6]|nr:MAG: hypothetical protein CVV35_10310 [Methanomicrobiales archaeon HGW-Methanomicrobiales-6]